VSRTLRVQDLDEAKICKLLARVFHKDKARKKEKQPRRLNDNDIWAATRRREQIKKTLDDVAPWSLSSLKRLLKKEIALIERIQRELRRPMKSILVK